MGLARTLLNKDFVAELGRITANFAILEATFSFAIIYLLELDERNGHIITAGLSFRNKMHLVDSLYREQITDEALLTQLKKILKLAAQAEERRNQITHSLWGVEVDTDTETEVDPNAQTVIRLKSTAKSGGLKKQGEIMTPANLKSIADGIALVSGDLAELMEATFPN